jgi:ubiquinone/menaquinone biosynthesis C-methylase UbiE
LRSQPDQEEFLRGCYLDLPSTVAAERFLHSEEWQATLEWIGHRPGRALDLGGGHGIAAYALARSGWSVIAAEPSLSGVTGAGAIATLTRHAHVDVSVVRAIGEALPFPNESFDVVYSRQVLHHVSDCAWLCAEVGRILRPEGVYLACAEHVITNERQRQRFLRQHPMNRFTCDENALRIGEYRQAFLAGGFESIQTLRSFDSAINYAPYTLAELRSTLRGRMEHLPGGRLLASLALGRRSYPALLRVLSLLDMRPGKPFSFVAQRPR